jgi:hypothetical protein
MRYFDFQRHAAGAVTTSTDWATLWTIPVLVTEAQLLLCDMRATVQCQYTEPASTFLGVALRFVWDGEPIDADPAFYQFDPAVPPPNVDTLAMRVDPRTLVAATPGPHTLSVEWQVLAAGEQATLFPGGANITIEGK